MRKTGAVNEPTVPLSQEEDAEWEVLTEQSRRPLGRMRPENVKKLSVATLARVRDDDHYEEHHGIPEVRACRICGFAARRLKPRHVTYLIDPHEPLRCLQYRDYCRMHGWGMPPVDSVFKLKQARDRNEAEKKCNPDGVKLQGQRSSRKQRDRIRTEPKYGERYNELSRAGQNRRVQKPGEASVPCLESPCHEVGLRYKWLPTHLPRVHGIIWSWYKRKHPTATPGPPDQMAKQANRLTNMRKKLGGDRGRKPERDIAGRIHELRPMKYPDIAALINAEFNLNKKPKSPDACRTLHDRHFPPEKRTF